MNVLSPPNDRCSCNSEIATPRTNHPLNFASGVFLLYEFLFSYAAEAILLDAGKT
jgi:hypothetical protein